MPTHLVTILHSKPVGDGTRTLRRVAIARDALGCNSVSIANIFPANLADVNALTGYQSEATWERGREEIQQELARDDLTDVLLGYGISLPSGAQREPYRAQLHWLRRTLGTKAARVWVFGHGPTHPSRWQRVVHRHAPRATVAEMARELLVPFRLESITERKR